MAVDIDRETHEIELPIIRTAGVEYKPTSSSPELLVLDKPLERKCKQCSTMVICRPVNGGWSSLASAPLDPLRIF